jgi:hypothetical protein
VFRVFSLAIFFVGPYLSAVTYVMGFPPAGGATLMQSGSAIGATGGTFAYSNFNSSAYQTLYWGVNTVANVAQSDVLSPGNMVFNSYNPSTGIIAFVSTAQWSFTDGQTNSTVSTNTQLIVQVQPYTGTNNGFLSSPNFLVGETTTKGALGVTGPAADPLFQVVSAANFQATFEFQTWDGSPSGIANGMDVADFYANNHGGSNTSTMATSVDFEFWWNVQKTTAKTVQVGGCKTNLVSYGTIQSAVSAVPAGATVQICPTTYTEQVIINAPITLQGITSGQNQSVVLAVPMAGLTQSVTGPVSAVTIFPQIVVQDAGPVTISGLTIDGNSSSCPNGAVAGVVFLSTTAPTSGKLVNSVVRNTGNGCGSPQAAAVYGENASGMASTITVGTNSIHSINGQAVIFGPNLSGLIQGNTISQVNGGISFQSAGPNLKATGNWVIGAQNAISLNSANGVTVQANNLINTSNQAISLNDNPGGGNNNVTKNNVNEGNCGISSGNAASTDVFLPNNVLNMAAAKCQ